MFNLKYLIAISFLLIYSIKCVDINDAINHHYKSGRNNHLYNSTWPSDHGDSSRSKYSLFAGLPSHFKPEDLKVKVNPLIDAPQWLYTQGEQSKYVFMIGGKSTVETYVTKADAITLDIIQQYHLPSALYLGGLLMHANEHVYCIHSNVLYRFWNGDLSNVTIKRLATKLNDGLVQTNGMLVSQDGLIIVKQWAITMDDIYFYSSAIPPLKHGFTSILVLCLTIILLINYKPISKRAVKIVPYTLLGTAIGVILFFIILIAVMKRLTSGNISPYKFIFDSVLFNPTSGASEIKFIDPITLNIVAEAILPERCSIARMSLVAVNNTITNESEDALILIGDQLIYQLRWRPRSKTIHLHSHWTKRYRRVFDGSFQATGAATFNETTYFTDNTFPVYLSGHNYRMYRMPLKVNELDSNYHPVDITINHNDINSYQLNKDIMYNYYLDASRLAPVDYGVRLTNTSKYPGFMFWSVVISPLANQVVTWDTANKNIQSRDLVDMSVKWTVNAWQTDCLTVATDRQHVYITDYNNAPRHSDDWLVLVGRFSEYTKYNSLTKFFIVVNTTNGDIIGNVTIGTEQSVRLSMIIPGAYNDVYVGTQKGLVRIYV